MEITRPPETPAGLSLADEQAAVSAGWPARWPALLADWRADTPQAGLWLMYAANYLGRTAGVRWALDPLRMAQRVPGAPELDPRDLAGLDLILLTHRHEDHLDQTLLRGLAQLPARWLVPEFLLSEAASAGVPAERVTVARPGEAVQVGGLAIRPFAGLHLEPPGAPGSARHGVPALGYCLEFAGRRWLFPGDVRDFSAACIPPFGPLDGALGHVWLGRGRALDEMPPLLEAYCRFWIRLAPRRLVLAHLYEFGRPPEELWTERHARLVQRRCQELAPELTVTIVRQGDRLDWFA